jgi:uncharacterized protein YodC (DUF2158 family)
MGWLVPRSTAFSWALLLISSSVVSQNDFSTECSGSTCEACLANGCGWVPALDKCLASCSFIADAPCYGAETFVNTSDAEICAIVAQDQADTQICSKAVDCSNCTGTILSDGNSTCQWYEITESCGTGGCNLLGCGSTVCSTSTQCEANSTCGECLEHGCAWALGGCLESCDGIADAACYSNATFPNLNETEICEIAFTEYEIASFCSALTNCSTCVATTKPDRSGACEWYALSGYCGSGSCNVGGCGSQICDQNDGSINCGNSTNCGDCLGTGCAWIAGSCLESCYIIADAACYSPEMFPGNTSAEICKIASDDQADSVLCDVQTGCGTCTSSVLSDGSSTCLWYIIGGDGFCCGGGSPCGLLGLGSSTCDCENATACDDCLVSGCGWIAGSCLESCDLIADTACFSSEYFPGNTSAEICEIASRDQADSSLCAAQTDCGTCTSSVLSDGSTTCQWFAIDGESGGVCCGGGSGCDLAGTGSFSCNKTSTCENATACDDCLVSECAWAVGSCFESCSVIADAPCYSAENFPNNTGSEICSIEENNTADEALCSNKTDCGTCTSTVKSDGSSNCQWYNGQNGTIDFCGIGGCDVMGVCGTSECTTGDSGTTNTTSSAVHMSMLPCFLVIGALLGMWLC